MQNFKGTEWEGMSEEEIFLKNRKLVKATILRKFPNHMTFLKTHGLDIEDLMQIGEIGLLNAIRSFNKDEKTQFRSYAINHIVWNITTQTKKESLRNKNTQSFELANIVSADSSADGTEGETIAIIDTIASNDDVEADCEDKVLKEQVINFLKNDEEINERLLYTFISLMNGKSIETIANELGIHRVTLSEQLKTKKAQRIKERLKNFLKNGENEDV